MAIALKKVVPFLVLDHWVLLKPARKAATHIRPMKEAIRPNQCSIRAMSFM